MPSRFPVPGRLRLGGVAFLLLFLLSGSPAVAAELPEILRATRLSPGVALTMVPHTTQWVTLESTEDLKYWTPVVQFAVQTDAALYVDLEAVDRKVRFFRVRSPGISVAPMQELWRAGATAGYSYRFDRISPNRPYLYTAQVSVRQGVKTIESAVADSETVVSPDPSLFPSIPELYEELIRAESERIRQLWVTYDPVHAFPARCTLDRRGGLGDGAGTLVQYRITGFVAGSQR